MYRRFYRQVVVLGTLVAVGVGGCRTTPAPLTPAAPPAPRAVLLRLHARPGWAGRYRVSLTTSMRFGTGGAAPSSGAEPLIRGEQFVTESVTAVVGDTISVVAVVDSSRVHMPIAVVSSTMLDSLMRGMMILRRQTDQGRTVSIWVLLPPQLARYQDEQHHTPPGVTPFIDSTVGHEFATLLPERPVPVGGTWTDTTSMTGRLEGTSITTYHLEHYEVRGGHRLAVIRSEMETSPLTSRVPFLTSAEPAHGVTEVWLDLDAGWAVRASGTMDMTVQTEMGPASTRAEMELAPIGRDSTPSQARSPMDSAVSLFLGDSLGPAAEVLDHVVRDDSTNAAALAYLADARLRLGDVPGSITLARLALRHAPCASYAHMVLAEAFNPDTHQSALSSRDSTWSHELAAVQCDSSDGNAWLILHIEAMRRDDTALEQRALRRMVESGFLSPGPLAYFRWVLASLPPRAILLTAGDLDTYAALAEQQVAGVRPDVAVVGTPLLNLPWYGRLVRDRFGVPLPLGDSAMKALVDGGGYLGDTLVALWREEAIRGTLGRPLAFSATMGADNVRRAWPGSYRWAGPFLVPTLAGDSVGVDTAAMHTALRTMPTRAVAGAAWGAGDRSPVRRAQPPFGEYATYEWEIYVDALVRAGRAPEARHALNEAETYMIEAGLADLDSLLRLASMRAEVARLP